MNSRSRASSADCPPLWIGLASAGRSAESVHGMLERRFVGPHRCVGVSTSSDVVECADDAGQVRPRVESQPGPLLPDGADVVGHGRVVVPQVESTVGGIDRTGSNACPLPVDESAEPASDPTARCPG